MMRQQAIAALVAAACMTGPVLAQPADSVLETLGDLINWSGAPSDAPDGMTSLTVGIEQTASACLLHFDLIFDGNGVPVNVRVEAPVGALDPNQVFIWDIGDIQRLNMFAYDGSDTWTMSSELAATHDQFERARGMLDSGDADGTCTADSCTLTIGGRPLEMPLPSLTTEEDIVATTVALQTLITQCGGFADTADN